MEETYPLSGESIGLIQELRHEGIAVALPIDTSEGDLLVSLDTSEQADSATWSPIRVIPCPSEAAPTRTWQPCYVESRTVVVLQQHTEAGVSRRFVMNAAGLLLVRMVRVIQDRRPRTVHELLEERESQLSLNAILAPYAVAGGQWRTKLHGILTSSIRGSRTVS